MRSAGRHLPLLALLTACSSGPAVAQAPKPDTGMGVQPNIYEVAPEQARSQEVPQVETGFIEVSGTAHVSVSPDRALASFAVETQARAAGSASADNASSMAAVVAAVRGTGLAGLEIETYGYTLRPDYIMVERGVERVREIGGYTAVNNVRVHISDVDAVGRLIDAAISAGANRVSSLAFEASNTEAARLEALSLAVARATAEARAIAAALGRELGAPLEVRGGAQAPSPRPQAFAAMEVARARADTPVEAGDQDVHASVTIRFALGAERSGR